MRRILKIASALIPLAAFEAVALYSGRARATRPTDLNCKLEFSLSAWSPLYKHSAGSGFVTCQNGKSMRVSITASGMGLMEVKSRVGRGTGRFTDVHRMSEVLGSYAAVEAHRGVVKSESMQMLTKDNVSLVLSAASEGIGLGTDIGEFVLLRGY